MTHELRGCYVAFGPVDAAGLTRLLRALYAVPGVERVQLGPARLRATADRPHGNLDRLGPERRRPARVRQRRRTRIHRDPLGETTMLLCDLPEALRCRELAETTGVRHAVIHIRRRSPHKDYVVILPYPPGAELPYKHLAAGVATTLYMSDEPITEGRH
jgi:hypothetical protein